jgi:hypothetical protein
MGLKYQKALFPPNLTAIKHVFSNSNQLYPPLYHVIISLWYQISGIKNPTAVLVNTPFILILMLSLYGLGCELGNRKVGLLTAILTPILPIFITLQERALIDYASVSMLILSFYILFKTQGLTNKKYSILLGMVIFLELSIKWPFVIPTIPFVFYAVHSFLVNISKRKIIIFNTLICIATASPGFIWYMLNYKNMLNLLNFFWNPNGVAQMIWEFPQGLTPNNIFLYLFTFPSMSNGIGVIVLAFFFASLFIRKNNPNLQYLIHSIAITYLVLTFLNDKSAFYMAYTYPLVIIVTIFSLTNIKSIFIRNFATFVFASAIIINYVACLFMPSNNTQFSFNFFKKNFSIFPNYDTKFVAQKWPTKYVVDNYIDNKSCWSCVLIFADNRFLNASNIRYYLALNGADIYPDSASNYYNPANEIKFNLKIMNKFTTVITKGGYPGLFANPDAISFINNYLNTNKNWVKNVIEAPDDSQIFVYTYKINAEN